MKVYTYCSYKGSLSGYQFAILDPDNVSAAKSLDSAQAQAMVPAEVTKWFWSRHGWKLALCAHSQKPSWGLLLMRGMEQAREFQRQLAEEKRKEIEAGNQYREKPKSWDCKIPDCDFYINLAFEGSLEELRPYAAAFLNELWQDGGGHMLNLFEPAFSAAGQGYEVNPGKLLAALQGLRLPRPNPAGVPNPAGKYRPPSKAEPGKLRAALQGLRLPLPNRKQPEPYIRLLCPSNGNTISRQERKQHMDDLAGVLLREESFSEPLLLYVSQGADEPEGMRANLKVELEYLLSIAKGQVRDADLF